MSCAGRRPDNLSTAGSMLRPCPSSPNCVCSDDAEPNHWIAPFALLIPPDEAWVVAVEVVEQLPRTTILSRTDQYLHAECRSPTWGFVDDLELSLRSGTFEIAVRSSSRIGYGDMGVNRERVETIRTELARRGVTRLNAP